MVGVDGAETLDARARRALQPPSLAVDESPPATADRKRIDPETARRLLRLAGVLNDDEDASATAGSFVSLHAQRRPDGQVEASPLDEEPNPEEAAQSNGGAAQAAAATPSAAPDQARPWPTGVRSMDRYLGGGLTGPGVWLVLGPPFTGKDLLGQTFAATGAAVGESTLMVLTDTPRARADERIRALAGTERASAVARHVEYFDMRSTMAPDLPADLLARYRGPRWSAQGLCRDIATRLESTAQPRVQRLVWESLSTFHAIVGAEGSMAALMQISDLVRRTGSCGLVLADPVAHSVAEVQFFKWQADGVIEMRGEGNNLQLRVGGRGLHRSSPWVRYETGASGLRVTGSWHEGRIP